MSLFEELDHEFDPEETANELKGLVQLIQGGAQGTSIILNGILNLVGKWIEALGFAVQAAGGGNPAGVVALAGFIALNVTTMTYLTTIEPFRTILRRLKLYDLVVALANQIGAIVKDINKFLTQPASGAAGPGKPDVQIPTIGPQGGTNQCPGDPNGLYGIQWTPQEWVQIVQSVSGFPTAGSIQTFTTRQCRDSVLAILRGDIGKTWYWTFTAVDLPGAQP